MKQTWLRVLIIRDDKKNLNPFCDLESLFVQYQGYRCYSDINEFEVVVVWLLKVYHILLQIRCCVLQYF